MISLQDYKSKITAMLDEALPRFAEEHPNVKPTAVALYSCSWAGSVALCLNSTDTAGSHQDNCPDFEYVCYEEMGFDEWEQEYSSGAWTVEYPASNFYTRDQTRGDEAFNEPFFNFLTDLAREYFQPGRSKLTAIWIGVQMLDSRLVKFWRM